MAVWDLNAKLLDVPAWKFIADYFGVQPISAMPAYAAGGYYYPEDSIGRIKAELNSYRDLGYVDFKIKIGGVSLREDIARIEAAIDLIGDASHLAVDANGRFNSKVALEYATAMAPYGLR